jgi:transposase InsO family protein
MTASKCSSLTGKPYGIERVCRVWGYPRSSFYLNRQPREINQFKHGKRGPKPKLSDEQILKLIREDLANSPFIGEGHRKVWARLKFGKGIRVGRNRVQRLMRENNLLSPRLARRDANPHQGEIITAAPDQMWGTDGTKVFTVKEGWAWLFAAVDHFNAECVGYHICKKGDRFNALEPISQGVKEHFGFLSQDSARGLRLRIDSGSQYVSEHFQNQIKFWGISASFAFIEQPQTNGVIERFFRTLKEQIIYGRVYETIEDLKVAVDKFVKLYNQEWRIERLGFLCPKQARENYLTGLAKCA